MFLIYVTSKRGILEKVLSIIHYNLLSEYNTGVCRRVTTVPVKIGATTSKTKVSRRNNSTKYKDFKANFLV